MKPNAKKKLAPEVSPSTEPPNRRRFLSWLWGGLGVLAAAEALWLVVSYLAGRRRPSVGEDSRQWVEAGSVEAFVPKTVSAFPRGRFYLACLADGGFLALSRRCTHLGCTVPWNAETGRFECPCHASVFDIRGEVLRSPAQQALDIHPVTIENGIVRVDAGRVVKRGAFRPDQVVYPE
jgi:cytochrome b6-f complex iron-sulfur subunit